MHRTSPFALVLAGVLLALLAGCSSSKIGTAYGVAEDDCEMAAAISKARQTLPQFWDVFETRERGESDFALKVKITDKNGTEHFWAADIVRSDGKIMGTINNAPSIVASVKLGDRIEILDADISDWLYLRDGKMFGNETVKPLFKKMSAEQVAKIKSIMATP